MTYKKDTALEGPLLPERPRIQRVESVDTPVAPAQIVATRNHEVIKRWAVERQADPATGEKTSSGPATVNVSDGGAGIRFNFPGAAPFRPIDWDEWFDNFDRNQCAFVYENDSSTPLSARYRIVKADELNEKIC